MRRAPSLSLSLALFLFSIAQGHAQTAPTFVDEAVCGDCHAKQQTAVAKSQHARAMQNATRDTVLGNFDGATFHKDNVTSRFFRRDGRFFVNTDGPDGKPADFEIKYTFGVEPLQQYLIEQPGGRLQALTIAWDTKARRWFSTYPAEHIDHGDVLHWTRTSQNWNTMCASCHATNVRKNYDAASESYATTYASVGVGCQACHGPGSGHLAWAKGNRSERDTAGFKGFATDVNARPARTQVDSCAYCHALRATLTPGYLVGQPLLDHALPVGIDGSHYFDDGQQREEVFILGSWLQSRMYQKGVVCSDCHDVHSGKTRAAGNALCTSCHNASGAAAGPHVDISGLKRKAYDTPQHTHHAKSIACIECHAPKRTYMVVDPRLDHAFRIPRPDLSAETGSPNACNGCHRDRDAKWAASAVAKWYGVNRRAEYHYGQAFAAGRGGRPGAAEALQRFASDRTQPAIVRAAAIEQLAGYPSARSLDLSRTALNDEDALVRVAAIHAVTALDLTFATTGLAARLSDPLRTVRIEAARATAPFASRLSDERRHAWMLARMELEAAASENADRPQSWVGLAQIAAATNDGAAAERALRQALKLEPLFVPALVNLADLMGRIGRESEGETLLRDAMRRMPKEARLQESLALSLVRQKRKSEALKVLASAQTLPTATARTSYLHAVALADAGRVREAIIVLETAVRKRGDRGVLLALASYKREAGDRVGARAALDRLAAINPGDPAVRGGAAAQSR